MCSSDRVRFALPFAVLAGVFAGRPLDAHAQGPLWLSGDRVHVGEAGTLYALALGPREVFAASAAGVLLWDFTQHRWNLPIPPIGDYPAGQRVVAMAHDRAGGELFLATATGDHYRFTPAFDRWERVFGAEADALPRDVRRALERRAGDPVVRDPVLDAVRGSLGLEPGLRRWPLTDAIAGERAGEYWIATRGGGLLHFDSRGLMRDWIPWGLIARGTAALAFDGARIWFGGDGRSPRNGVAAADPALGRFLHFDAAEDGAPAGFVAEILASGDAVWFASSDGVYRFDAGRGEGRRAWSRLTTREGLPSYEATSLAASGAVVWAGTRRGLTAIAGDEIAGSLFAGRPVHRLAERRDTVWVATADGLWILPAASTAPLTAEPAPGTAQHAALRGAVEDVVAGDEGVYAFAGGQLYRWSGGAWSTALRDAALERIGPVMRLAYTDGRVWVTGTRGVAWSRGPGAGWRTLDVPRDIPIGPVLDVLVIGEHVWVATPEGATRLRVPDRS